MGLAGVPSPRGRRGTAARSPPGRPSPGAAPALPPPLLPRCPACAGGAVWAYCRGSPPLPRKASPEAPQPPERAGHPDPCPSRTPTPPPHLRAGNAEPGESLQEGLCCHRPKSLSAVRVDGGSGRCQAPEPVRVGSLRPAQRLAHGCSVTSSPTLPSPPGPPAHVCPSGSAPRPRQRARAC